MNQGINLVDLGFKSFTIEEKREVFMILDIIMKRYHERNYMITSFDPKDISYMNGEFNFDKIARISPINTTDKSDAIVDNIVGLSNLAFCSYLPSYDLKNGLLNIDVVSEQFDSFSTIFNSIDRSYYRNVLVNSYKNKQLPDDVYYYDYVNKTEKNNSAKGASTSLVKATAVGRLYADQDNQAAFGHIFFFLSMVASITIALIGLTMYLINL